MFRSKDTSITDADIDAIMEHGKVCRRFASSNNATVECRRGYSYSTLFLSGFLLDVRKLFTLTQKKTFFSGRNVRVHNDADEGETHPAVGVALFCLLRQIEANIVLIPDWLNPSSGQLPVAVIRLLHTVV